LIAAYRFQENLIKTMVQIENTYFDLAAMCNKNCLVICDRGIMDASACKCLICSACSQHSRADLMVIEAVAQLSFGVRDRGR
jgi:hypothetical protein